MAEHSFGSPRSIERPKKRKLKYRRTTRACTFCRKRKVRCSGSQPCDTCAAEGVVCEYGRGRFTPVSSSPVTVADCAVNKDSNNTIQYQPDRAFDDGIGVESSRASSFYSSNQAIHRRDTCRDTCIIDVPQKFAQSHHVGPNAGVSFLYQTYSKDNGLSQNDLDDERSMSPSSQVPLVSYGDVPPLNADFIHTLPIPSFTSEQILDLIDKYFRYISPTIRFLHHPTVKEWADSYVKQEKTIRAAQKATVLLICAQTLLHTPASPSKQPAIGKGDMPLSMACAATAKTLLENEQGAPSLASVQARIALTLYLLSSFRLSECRFIFSFTVTLAISLGIHRKQSTLSPRVDKVDRESKKRAFWSIYVLDGYLSVMLGRPRLIRNDDIDQPFPQNIDDHDLSSSEPIEDLPKHGNLEAFIAHAMLSKLTDKMNDELYPLHPLSGDEVLRRSTAVLKRLGVWQQELPDFLKPRQTTLMGQRTFERQNTILKLASAHVRILATRRCLISIVSQVEPHPSPFATDAGAEHLIRECISAIIVVLDTVEKLIQHGQCNAPFWSTQYIALVAISTLYVLIIQGVRNALPGDIRSLLDTEMLFAKTKLCQEHLTTLPPKGSQAERHYLLLNGLGIRALEMWKSRKDDQKTRSSKRRRENDTQTTEEAQGRDANSRISVTTAKPARKVGHEPPVQSDVDVGGTNLQETLLPPEVVAPDDMPENLTYGPLQTDISTSDINFGEGFDYGWKSLDTIGICTMGIETFSQVGF